MRRLSTLATVDTFVVCEQDKQPHSVPLEVRGDRNRAMRTLVRMLTKREPYLSAKLTWSPHWGPRVASLIDRAANYRIAITSQWPGLLLATEASVIPALHIAHNVDHVLSATHDPWPFRLIGNHRRTRRLELEMLSKLCSVLALSASDVSRLELEGISAKPLSLAPVLTNERRNRSMTYAIGFIGKLSWPPNSEALAVLLEKVMPLVRVAMRPAPRLLVAGRGSEGVRGVGVTPLGQIEDLGQFYSAIDLVVIPRLGTTTGISVKMLEAVEHGVAVVAPRSLIEDSGMRSGCIAADDPNEIVSAILDFYNSHMSVETVDSYEYAVDTLKQQVEEALEHHR